MAWDDMQDSAEYMPTQDPVEFERQRKMHLKKYKEQAKEVIDELDGPFVLFSPSNGENEDENNLRELICFAGQVHDIVTMVVAFDHVKQNFLDQSLRNLPEDEGLHLLNHLKDIDEGTQDGKFWGKDADHE